MQLLMVKQRIKPPRRRSPALLRSRGADVCIASPSRVMCLTTVCGVVLCELCRTATVGSLTHRCSGLFFFSSSREKKHLVNLLKMGDETKINLILSETLCLLLSTPVRFGFSFSFLLVVSCTLL